MGKRKSASWMYMSRLAAQKEWAFMKVRPIDMSSPAPRTHAHTAPRSCTSTTSRSRVRSTRRGTPSSWSSSTPTHCTSAPSVRACVHAY